MSSNYLRDSVGIIVWSAAEMAVTLICIGIPICRPLYKKYLDKLTSRNTSSSYKNISGSGGNVPLRTIGGSELPPLGHNSNNKSLTTSRTDNTSGPLPIGGDTSCKNSVTTDTQQDLFRESSAGASDEESLQKTYRH